MKEYIKPELERIEFESEVVTSSMEGGDISNTFAEDGPWG